MLSKPRLTRILGLALPIMGAMVSQSLLNLVDTAMVGALGDASLAAVGLGGFVNSLCLALILGVSSGVQAMAARRKGEGKPNEAANILNAALLLVVGITPALSVVLYVAAPRLLPLLNGDPAVQAELVPYFQARIVAAVCIAMNYSFRGYWNGVDKSRLYLATLLVIHSSNVALNWVLIFGNLGAPALGATGAGIASSLAALLGTVTYFWLAWRFSRVEGFLSGLPSRADMRTLIALSVPNGMQQFSFIAAFTALYWIIGRVGTSELAAANVLINVMLVALLPGFGLGLAAATLVANALGRREPDDAVRWNWEVALLGGALLALMGVPMWLFPDAILAIFIRDPATLDIARWPMRIIGVSVIIDGVRTIVMHSLLGAGDARRVMLISVGCQWVLGVLLAYLIGPVLGFGLLAIWLSQELNRLVQLGLFVRIWRQRRWASLAV